MRIKSVYNVKYVFLYRLRIGHTRAEVSSVSKSVNNRTFEGGTPA